MLKLSSKIKMVASDFDGVLSDGVLYLDENMKQQKKMNYKDIMGVSILLKNGIKFAIISGETSDILDYFKHKFNIDEIHKGIREKGIVLEGLMKKYNLCADEVAYIGDDINDIPAFNCVKYKIAPKNANPILKNVEGIQFSQFDGGNGAFRELVDSITGEKNG